MDVPSAVSFYGKIIANQGDIYWTEKYIVITSKEVLIAVPRNPPEEALVKEKLKDIPGQQTLFG